MVIKYCIVILITIVLIYTKDANSDEKVCRFMNPREGVRLQRRSLWNHLTGFYCYFYITENRLNFKYRFDSIKYNDTVIHGSLVDNGTTFFWYDFKNETSLRYIRDSFLNDVYFNKWKICAQEAADCCDNDMDIENIHPSDEYPCPAVWDSWSCFSPAKAGSTAKLLCPEITFSSEFRSCELMSEKQCFADGTWILKTNYDVCAIAPVLRNRHNFHIIVLAVATVFSFPAAVIFLSFRNLRQKLMLILHRNLIIMIMIRNILSIMAKEIIIMHELRSSDSDSVMDNNSVSCRVLAFFENVAKNGIFACMCADGFYVHQSIVRPFIKEPKLTYIYSLVIVFSFLPSLLWALLRGIHHGTDCWMVDNSNDHWVPDGFRFVILAINTILLLDIIRVLIFKLRRGGISQQTRTIIPITFFLIPLFGIHIIIISNRNMVSDNTCASHDIYYMASYLLEGFQGVMVPILFCYINSDVRHELMNALRKLIVYYQQKRYSSKGHYGRRATTATYVESFSEG